MLDVRVQNVASCTLSFPYTLSISSQGPGQRVDYELRGTVTNLPVKTLVQTHQAVPTTAFTLRTAGIVLSPHTEPVRTECPNLVGSWAGPYVLVSENYDDDWEYGVGVQRFQVQGQVAVTVSAPGVVAIRYEPATDPEHPLRGSTHLVGTLTPDAEFRGQGLTRHNNAVVDTVQATGLLRLGEPDPQTGQPPLTVGLHLQSAQHPADVLTLQARVQRP